ncbi:MAG: hypothetical protein IPO38_00440 [Rhodocyclaceae bacterium]|nr:hypothetical protein [Rhodocyclaceae bacterium]MBP6108670.1 hypothetical protein [Rhodocyclaceae bacterium]
MTLPDERYRALMQARELLQEIKHGQITDLAEARRQAKVVLRHYPDNQTLDFIVMSLNPVRPGSAVFANYLWPPPERKL